MATAHTEAAPVAMPTTGQARSRLDVALLVVAASGAVIAGATAFGAGGRAWDVALAITIASGGLYAVRRWGLPALLLIPLLLGPLWPGSVASGVGDEPHYLVIAESVVSDHDLAVA